MPLIVPRPSTPDFVDAMVQAFLDGATLRLYKNDVTPGPTHTVANYTEADFTGYAGIVLDSWNPAALDATNRARAVETVRTFTQTSAGVSNDVYGYYITEAGGALLLAERLSDAPRAMNAEGKTLSLLPAFTARSEF